MITVLPHYDVPLCIQDEIDHLIGCSSYFYDQYDFEFCEVQTYHTVEKWKKYVCDWKTSRLPNDSSPYHSSHKLITNMQQFDGFEWSLFISSP